MPDLRWWASWPCGVALAAMVVLGCAAHPWRCDGLTVVSVAVGGVACAPSWPSPVYSGRNSGGGGGFGYQIWRSGGRIRPSLGRIWCSCGGSDYRRWCSAGHRRRLCQGGGSTAWWFGWAASSASGRQSNGGGVVPSAMPWWRGRPWRWQACGAVVVLPALPGPVEATLPCWGLPARVPVRAQGAAAGFPPFLLALSFFSMVAILWRWLGFMPALGGGPRLCRSSPHDPGCRRGAVAARTEASASSGVLVWGLAPDPGSSGHGTVPKVDVHGGGRLVLRHVVRSAGVLAQLCGCLRGRRVDPLGVASAGGLAATSLVPGRDPAS
jgi:hypothetical protein